MKKILLGTLVSLFLWQSAQAEEATLYGPGARYCKEFQTEENQKTYPFVYFWVQGFVSARNIQIYKETGKGFDPLPPTFTWEQQAAFLVNYCAVNPESDPSAAAEAIVQKLQTIDALKGTLPP